MLFTDDWHLDLIQKAKLKVLQGSDKVEYDSGPVLHHMCRDSLRCNKPFR